MKRFLPIAGGLVLILCPRLNSLASDWPQFRGPQAAGVDSSKAAPTTWNVESGQNVRWKTDLPGLGHASPVIAGDRIYVVTAVGGGE